MKLTKLFTFILLLLALCIFSAFSVHLTYASSGIAQGHSTKAIKDFSLPLIYPVACNGSNVTLHLEGDGSDECYYGSGTVFPNFYTEYFYPGNWSGYVYTYNYYPHGKLFCDFKGFNLNDTVITIVVSSSREPGCP